MSNNQLVCIKRPEPGLSSLFEEMYLNERLVDVTLSCCDGQLQAHKLVLAACSQYFSSLFDKLANPFHYPVIVIKDMQIEDLKLIVEFMYRGQLTISQEKLMSLAKSAEGLQINGLPSLEELVNGTTIVEGTSNNNGGPRILSTRYKRAKKSMTTHNNTSTSSSNHNNSSIFIKTYQQQLRGQGELDTRSSPRPDKLLEQSMVTGESLDGSDHQFLYTNNEPTTSNKNLNNQNQLHNPGGPSMHIPHLSIDQQQQQQQLTSQLQVLSHSLAANRSSSLAQSTANGQSSNNQLSPQQARGRVHPCNICWKTFREKANLKRHLQVHNVDRIIYACPDCNKTFSWKDNYIRHTKTAHHMNNIRS